MKSFFEMLRPPGKRHATPEEMEGFGTEAPDQQTQEYIVDPPMIVPDLETTRTRQREELEGVDRGISLEGGLEPGTDIPAERDAQVSREGREARAVRFERLKTQMHEEALKRAGQMDSDALDSYIEQLTDQAADAELQVEELETSEQGELAQDAREQAELFRTQADAVKEFIVARHRAGIDDEKTG